MISTSIYPKAQLIFSGDSHLLLIPLIHFPGSFPADFSQFPDSEQNSKFMDHYVEIPIDLSEVLFIATANSAQDIPRPLLDRMEIIEVTSYTENEKMHIASEHLVKKQLKKNGLKKEQLTLSKDALSLVIRGYTREAGVRNLERKLACHSHIRPDFPLRNSGEHSGGHSNPRRRPVFWNCGCHQKKSGKIPGKRKVQLR